MFKVVLSSQSHACGKLVSPGLARWQGAALYVFDDAVFSEADFESIQRVGDGVKRGDPTKTGQFGLGFNSCYHVTDVPSFVTGRHLVVFDPHQSHGLEQGAAGAFYDVHAPGFAERCCDTLAAFAIEQFGFDTRSGTWGARQTSGVP